MSCRTGAVLALAVLSGCGSASAHRLPAREPLWDDPDRHPVPRELEEVPAPGLVWDGMDQTVFRPVARFFAAEHSGEAVDVNAVDEVPSSSWFTNRIGLLPMTPDDVAAGPCTAPALDVDAAITITSAKGAGASPGFVVEGTNGLHYLMKFDDVDQGPRPTAADTIGSKIYYAAGFTTPCNRVVFFDRNHLRVAPGVTWKDWTGDEIHFTPALLDMTLTRAARLRDGRYRASLSQWLDGKPIGPWSYSGTRDDDPNDVVPHEDRRELRGSRLLAAWLGHTDARVQNTLGVWIDGGAGYGWVRHDLIDFSDCFGALWSPVETGRRMGHAYWFDAGMFAGDFLTLGAIERPWDRARFGPSGKVFGYYSVEQFDPTAWRMEYPNPAFSRMTERDGAWMARIIARFTDEHIRRVIRTGRLGSPLLESELLRILEGRRDAILRRYLTRLSPLERPTVSAVAGGLELCARDLATVSGIAGKRHYAAALHDGRTSRALHTEARGADVCAELPTESATASPHAGALLTVDLNVTEEGAPAIGALRVDLRRSASGAAVVGVERPEP